jgi:sulfur relay protein TusB/DsrH
MIMSILDNSRGGLSSQKKNIFLLTKTPRSIRSALCIKLIRQSKESVLYLVGDGVYNLLDNSIKDLSNCIIIASKEDMDARGVQSEDTVLSSADLYDRFVAEMMNGCNRVYAF